MGDGFFGAKTIFMLFFMSNPNPCFCAGSNHYLSLCFPFNSDDSLFKPFFLQLHLCLFSGFYYLFFRDISLNSQEQFILFSVTFHLIFNGFSFIFVVIWAIFLKLSNLYSFIYSFISLFLFVFSFELFSHFVILFRVLVKLC